MTHSPTNLALVTRGPARYSGQPPRVYPSGSSPGCNVNDRYLHDLSSTVPSTSLGPLSP